MANLREDRLLANSSMTSGSPSPLVPQFSPSLPHGQGERAVIPPSTVSAPSTSVPDYSLYSQQHPGQINPGPSFSLLDVVEQYTNLTGDGSFAHNDQDSIRMFLDWLVEILATRLSGVTIGNEDAYDHGVHFQAISGHEHADPFLSQRLALQHSQDQQLSEQACSPLLQGSIGVSGPLLSQRSPDMLPCTPGDANDGTSPLIPQNRTCSDGQIFYQQVRPGIVKAGQKKVQCTWTGCLKVLRKDGLTRHLNEVHLRVVKGVCTRCGQVFQRPYLKREHEVICRG